LADGTILDCLNTNKKDNAGYDLKHLFIGSEGTLGVVTKVAIQCPPKPKAVNLALFGIFQTLNTYALNIHNIFSLGFDNYGNLLKLSKIAKRDLSEIISSCEYVDKESMDCVKKNLGLICPIGTHNFYMFIETSGSHDKHDLEKLNYFLKNVTDKGLPNAGMVAKDSKELKV
jgi:D-2-hydroxyglutarate dehydrogenase